MGVEGLEKGWMGYRVLDYGSAPRWGEGARVARLLGPLEREIWDLALPFQDRRGDDGHAELVVWTTIEFCRLLGWSEGDREVAVLAAIVHDVGYAGIAEIRERFHRAFDDLRAGLGRGAFDALKEEHEVASVEQARRWLSGYGRWAEVRATVACHDTRGLACPLAGRPMWDADRLWRFSVLGHRTYRKGLDFEGLLAVMERELAHGDWQTEVGPWAAAMELVNSLWVMFPERLPEGLPERLRGWWSRYAAGLPSG